MKRIILIIVLFSITLLGFRSYYGATNFDRLVLGEANFGEDPNTTADITGQNDEYISNYTNGSWDFGSASLTTTGSVTGSLAGDTNSFQKTSIAAGNNEKLYDTVTISGVTTSSVFLVSIKKAGLPVAANLLAWHVISGKLVVSRADTTTAGQTYSYLLIK